VKSVGRLPEDKLTTGELARRTVFRMLWQTQVRRCVLRVPLVRRVYNGWWRQHPFDLANGTETSGFVPAQESEAAMSEKIVFYAASQPSIVRATLARLPDIDHYAFVDLGCGKGRPLVVASEFPFPRILGIEIGRSLVDIARRNAAVIAQRYPRRTRIEVLHADATVAITPLRHVVYFMYHPFGEELVREFAMSLEAALRHDLEHAFLIYYNPVHGDVFDASRRLARWSTDRIPYATDELGYGPNLADNVVVWQTLPSIYPPRSHL
jgi:SAM-dependent methyltransferase